MPNLYNTPPPIDSLFDTIHYSQKLTYIKDEPIDRPITFESSPIPMKKGLHAYIPIQSLVTKEAFSSMRMGEDNLERAKIEMVICN